jgi:phenylpropionate dioxygenase-like ring-hydroxylating dioxygenase large terminal subunit
MPGYAPPRPATARQLLPKECYMSPDWFEREQRELFSRAWSFACVAQDLPEAGDYMPVQIGRYPMFVIRGRDGALKAYHNTCRHRGTEMLEKKGNCRHGIVCPYHAWTYNVDDGSLRGLPKKDLCFPGLKMDQLGLHKGGIGQIGDLVFVNPQAQPDEDFETWLAGANKTHMWPHDISQLSEKRPVRYDIMANWKAFCENAMDGYHLSYLHDKTLMGPEVENQDWDDVGRHWVFMSHGESPNRTESHYTPIPGVDTSGRHPVVWQFFPNSGVLASSIFFSAYTIVPVGPEQCYLELRTWMMPKEAQDPTKKPARPSGTSGHGHIMADGKRYISIETLSCPAMETLDFQIEDMWVCEQQQKALHSPMFKVGPLADVGETSLTFFQANVLDFVPLEGPGVRMAAQ